MSRSRRPTDESHAESKKSPTRTRVRYRARCPDCGFSTTRKNAGDAYGLQYSGCPECGRGLGVSPVRPADGWTTETPEPAETGQCDSETKDGEPCELPAGYGREGYHRGPCHIHAETDHCDGETVKGGTCNKPAGWGTNHDEGRCVHHRDEGPEIRTDGGGPK